MRYVLQRHCLSADCALPCNPVYTRSQVVQNQMSVTRLSIYSISAAIEQKFCILARIRGRAAVTCEASRNEEQPAASAVLRRLAPYFNSKTCLTAILVSQASVHATVAQSTAVPVVCTVSTANAGGRRSRRSSCSRRTQSEQVSALAPPCLSQEPSWSQRRQICVLDPPIRARWHAPPVAKPVACTIMLVATLLTLMRGEETTFPGPGELSMCLLR